MMLGTNLGAEYDQDQYERAQRELKRHAREDGEDEERPLRKKTRATEDFKKKWGKFKDVLDQNGADA